MHQSDLALSQQRQWDEIRELIESVAAVRPVRKVAVVGNAPLRPDRERAAELDSSDLVFRVNSLVLDEPGSEPCLGSTCHVVLLSRNTRMTKWVFHGYRSRAYFVMQAGFTVFRTTRGLPDHWPADLGAIPIPNGAVTARLAEQLDADREPGTLIPTTGITALFLAHELFPAADMVATGFSFLDARSQTEWAHHNGDTTAVDQRHQLEHEARLLQSWIEDSSVRFFN